MSDAGIRQARQSDSRKGSPGNHDVTGDAGELVVSRFKVRARDERREFDHAFANAAQSGVCSDDEGSAGPAADDVFADEKGTGRVHGIPGGIGENNSGRETMNFFGQGLCITK